MSKTTKQLFECTSPCKSCPYRKDVKKEFWHIAEFQKLLDSEQTQFGSVYLCHQNDGSACIGFLMNQDRRRFPSIALRMTLIDHNITREYLDQLECEAEMFDSIEEMCKANFPELF